jgi:hypothetical protein
MSAPPNPLGNNPAASPEVTDRYDSHYSRLCFLLFKVEFAAESLALGTCKLLTKLAVIWMLYCVG